MPIRSTAMMDNRKPPEFSIELSADRSSVKDVVKDGEAGNVTSNTRGEPGILHTIFFHRFFTPIYPSSHDVLDLTLPYVSEDDIESLIETKTTALVRALDTASTQQSPQYTSKAGRGCIVLQFLEKKRRKAGWFGVKGEEETVWENWVISVTLTSARSEMEAARNKTSMETSLQKAAMKVVTLVNAERGHIPPITTNETNPFPYQILVNPRTDGWTRPF
ncbi:hypothetical protein D0867_07924 [Hortaea werneckii]|uniref:Autophagy-related protein 101 n=2 Tax=Hortaea werneckii TaxID=91943 RepID=A0A3M6Z9A9_HORWE|nr:hypothetical protein D0867_07924 [Hortaea werneckii]